MRIVRVAFLLLFVLASGAFVGVGDLPPGPDPEGRVPLPFFTIAPSNAMTLPASIDESNVISFCDLDESVHRMHRFSAVARRGVGAGRLELVLRQTPDGAYVVAWIDPGDGSPTEVTLSRWDGFQHAATLSTAEGPPGLAEFRLDVVLDGPRFLVRVDGKDVLTATDASHERGAVFLRAKRGAFDLLEFEARGVGPDGEPYLETSRADVMKEATRDRAFLLLIVVLLTVAFARFSSGGSASVGDILEASVRGLAIGFSPALVEYVARPGWIVAAYAVAGIIAATVLGFRLRDHFERAQRRSSAVAWAISATLACVCLVVAVVRREAQDPILAELASKTAVLEPYRELGPRAIEPGQPLVTEGPYADGVLRFTATIEPDTILEARVRGNARRAAGVALVLSTDPLLGCGFFRQDVTHDEAIGPRSTPLVPGRPAVVEIEFSGPEYRARIDGREITAADGRHVTGAIGILVPRGRAEVVGTTVTPTDPERSPRSTLAYAGLIPGLTFLVLAFLMLGFGARHAGANALGLASLSLLPFCLLRGDATEFTDLILAALVPASILALAIRNAAPRIGATRLVALSVAALIASPVLAVHAAVESRVSKDFDSLGRCRMSREDLAVLHPKVRQLNDWFTRHQFRGRSASLSPPTDRPRIIAIGSSSTWGFGLPDRAAADWPSQVERILDSRGRPVEVLNAGVPGAVAETLYLYLEQVLVQYRPDVVTLSLTHNDAYELTQLDVFRWLTNDADSSPLRRLSRLPALSRAKSDGKSRLLRLRERFSDSTASTVEIWRELGFHEDPPAPVARFEAALRRFAELARERGIRLVFIQEPLRSDRRFLWKQEFRAVMDRLGAEFDFPVAKPQERLALIADQGPIFLDDVHPTVDGYRVVAEAIADVLETELDRVSRR